MIFTGRIWLSFSALFTFVWLFSIFVISVRENFGIVPRALRSDSNSQQHERRAPFNSTLGFERIESIVLSHRDDQLDILALLGHVYGLDINIARGVYPEDVKVRPRETPVPKDKDESEGNKRTPGEIACWRAHANLWRKMLREKWSSLLVFEGDVDWGMNIRQEFLKLTEIFPELESRLTGRPAAAYTDSDPYRSQSWDFLQLGWCVESERILFNGSVQYPSPTDMTPTLERPFQPPFSDYGVNLGPLVKTNHKLAKVSLGGSCTVGYAITPSGAAKLLHKTTRKWHSPVDVAISKFSSDLDLVAFSVSPPLFTQRKYTTNSGKSSDIGNYRKRDRASSILDFNSTAAANLGFDGEQHVWVAATHLTDASATMAMSGKLWPEKTSLGPAVGREWVLSAKEQVLQNQFDKQIGA